MQPVKGMDWIEKLVFYKDDLLVLGFHTVCRIFNHHITVYLTIVHCSQTSMVLHSTAQNKHIMEVSCGGGHRSYGASSINQVSIGYMQCASWCLTGKALFLRWPLKDGVLWCSSNSLCSASERWISMPTSHSLWYRLELYSIPHTHAQWLQYYCIGLCS